MAKAKLPCSHGKNIFQRGKHSFRVKMMSQGHTINKTFDTLADAQIFRDLTLVNASLDHNEAATHAARAKKVETKCFTLADAIKKYRVEKSEKKKGWEKEKSQLDKISRCTAITTMPIYQIKAEHILQLLEWIKTSGKAENKNKKDKTGNPAGKPTSDATLRRYFNIIRHIFQIAVEEWKKIDSNPCAAVPKSARPKDGKGRDRRLRGDEYEQMTTQLKGQAKIIFILAVETAMRRGDQLNMRWEHLDLKRGTLYLTDGKGGDARTVFLSNTAIAAFKNLEVQGINGKIITITARQIRYAWVQAREAIGAPDLCLHDLRHEATSRLYEKGMGDIEVTTMTAHKTMAMLKKYAHLKQEHIMEKLNRPARSN